MICPKCGHEWDDDSEMNFCKKCGTALHNYCSNPDCSCNESDSLIKFNHNDCFCHVCGSKTTYYENGLITPDLE